MGVSVLKQNYDTKKKVGSGGGKSRLIKADEFQYRSNQKEIETKFRKFRKLRNNLKKDKVIAAEFSLSHFKSSLVNKDRFVEYLQEPKSLQS
ncbi:hypothetical protein RO3G_04422 [Rhizopus delemar RA 99-880]|uniref:Uncharacterized protein n=1 Tax=Rhizopus delemar (strain RA 99-880 / ATCC MYA-4621 / FGSC 9543 / NRRL 43880) TaxID=246409 RepID=I1BU37_RHIO9|nr:hypothetical protein RO3G_04422 [Rhizopus delemar RA 99-880]|eukprot:EIE79717.1 hypothetical protein RO3G_04422 [Rhizopus delemar RA 99-880]